MDHKLKVYEYVFNPETMPGIELISLVYEPATELVGVALSAQVEEIKFSAVDGEERVLVSPILVPKQMIFRKEIGGEPAYVFASKETIKQLQQSFVKNGNQNNSNIEHKGDFITGITFTEQWLVRDSSNDTINAYGFKDIPEGSWCVKAQLSQELWDDYIKTGKVKGFSVEGLLGIKRVELARENNTKIKINKMNKQTFEQIVAEALKQVSLAADLNEFKDVDGNSYFATELVVDTIVTDADGAVIADKEFVIDDNKYKTDANGVILSIEPVEAVEDEVEVEQAEVEVPAVEGETEVEVEVEDPQVLKDKIAEQEKTIADLEAKNIELQAMIVEMEDKAKADVALSKQTPASEGIKKVALNSNIKPEKETLVEMLDRLRQ
jgi:P2-related tail formation protein